MDRQGQGWRVLKPFAGLALALVALGCGGGRAGRSVAPPLPRGHDEPLSLMAPDAALDAALLPETPAAPAPGSDFRIRVDLRLEASGALEVSYAATLSEFDREFEDLCLVFDDLSLEEGPQGYARFVTPLEPVAPSPEPSTSPSSGAEPMTASEPAWEGCFDRVEGDLWLRYRVELAHHRARPSHGLEDAPHPIEGGLYLLGRAFVPALRFGQGRSIDGPVELRLHLPEGWEQLDSLGAPLEGGLRRAASIREAQDATFYLGRFARREIELEGVRLTLVSGDFGEEVLGPLLELTQRTLREASAMLGPPRGASVLIGYERAERGVDGGVIGDAIAIRSDRILEPRAYRAEGRVLVHELAHLFNQSPDYWAQEGLTRYLELLLRARLDGLSEDLAFDGLMGSYAAYREGVGARAIGEATPSMGSWPYEAGAVFGFCVDTHLRERGSSLLEAHRAARQAGAWPIPAEALLDAIEARSAPSGAYARALLMRRGGVDFGACLRRAGRSLRASPYLALGAEAIERVLRADRNLSFPPTIGRPYPASGFQAGDRLLEAAGVPITALDELGWALQGRAFDESVRFRILRQGSRRIVQQRLPNLRALGEEAFRFHAVPNEGAPAAASPFARTE